MAFLLDTNVLSELRKGARCDPHVLRWARSTTSRRHCISVLSLGEIRKGIEILRRKAPGQCAAFERWLERLEIEYSQDILPVTAPVADHWGRLAAARTLPATDGLIAATALEFGLTVATRNTGDFAGTGVAVVNPFANRASGGRR
jgi:predicted nucleic acid-binding protein